MDRQSKHTEHDYRIEINVPDGRHGNFEIRTFEVNGVEAHMHNVIEAENQTHRYINPGVYKGLYDLGGVPERMWMSNTPSEVLDHLDFIQLATGDVLIFGLGLGVVVQALLDKAAVTSITVIEKEESIIHLAGRYYENLSPKVSIIHADAFDFEPGEKYYEYIWFDIWDTITPENLPEMQHFKVKWELHSKIRMCWKEERCRELLVQEINEGRKKTI